MSILDNLEPQFLFHGPSFVRLLKYFFTHGYACEIGRAVTS